MNGPRILISRFSAIGDCVLTCWAVTALRQKFPDAHITWAVQRVPSAVIDTEHLVNQLHIFDREKWRKNRGLKSFQEQLSCYAALKGQRFDYGFDFQGHSKTALAIHFGNPKERFSFRATDLLAKVINPPRTIDASIHHEVEKDMALVNLIGVTETPTRPMMPDVSNENLTQHGWHGEKVATIQLGGTRPDKIYGINQWIEVAQSLARNGLTVVYLDSTHHDLPEGANIINLTGKLSLREAMAAVASSSVHLCGDTGTGHLAAAYGVPVVTAFGLNPPARFRPYTDQLSLFQGATCASDIQPEVLITEAILWANESQ